MKKLFYFAVAIALFGCNGSQPTSSPPAKKITLSAGADTTYPKNAEIYVVGTIVHSDFPDSLVTTRWSQISGPGTASIADSSSTISQVTFPSTGLFSFKLTAWSGSYSASDTVRLTITDSIPFKVLSPTAGQRITIGDSILIRWQEVTPQKMIIFLTCDNGKTYSTLTPLALNLEDTTWGWRVADTLSPSESCRIRVAWYFQRSNYTESGIFSLVH